MDRVLGFWTGVVLCPRSTVVNVWGADMVWVWTEAMVCVCVLSYACCEVVKCIAACLILKDLVGSKNKT